VKAASNESVDGRMTACDDEIGRRTTTQQPANERRRPTACLCEATLPPPSSLPPPPFPAHSHCAVHRPLSLQPAR
jgi:hypothetical protein